MQFGDVSCFPGRKAGTMFSYTDISILDFLHNTTLSKEVHSRFAKLLQY